MKATTSNLSSLSFRVNLRRELRFGLLAAMETCWVYSVLAFLAATMGLPRVVSPLSLFAAYWLALVVGRVLPRRRERWIVLQSIAIGIALVTVVAVARIELYPESDLLDLAWLPRYVLALLSFTGGIASEHLAALGVLYAFIRGLGFGQRPLTLWFTGFQFRIGIVVFFLLFLVAGLVKPFDSSGWVFIYFFISLLAIALARVDEMESDVRFGPRWAVTFLAAVTLVIFLGLVLLQFLTLESAAWFLGLFAPVWNVVAAILTIVMIPAALLVGWLVDLLQPMFTGLDRFLAGLRNLIPPNAEENLRKAQEQASQLAFLAPLVKTLVVLAIVLIVGYLIANALNRRMKKFEEDAYIRESLSEAERRAQRAGLPKKRSPARRRAGQMAAESIRRIYAALVARAGEAGLPRALAETPYEYLPRLEREWQEQSANLSAITDAYVAVHYGEREFGAAEVDRLRAIWQRVEKVLQERRLKP